MIALFPGRPDTACSPWQLWPGYNMPCTGKGEGTGNIAALTKHVCTPCMVCSMHANALVSTATQWAQQPSNSL